MMKTLGMNEGDPVRLTGTKLPKGKFVKLQAQSTDFLEVSDAKAVYVGLLTFLKFPCGFLIFLFFGGTCI